MEIRTARAPRPPARRCPRACAAETRRAAEAPRRHPDRRETPGGRDDRRSGCARFAGAIGDRCLPPPDRRAAAIVRTLERKAPPRRTPKRSRTAVASLEILWPGIACARFYVRAASA